MASDLYETLGVERGSDEKTIHRAYRQLAKRVHPDSGGDGEAFARLQRAHAILTDPERRERYDATGDQEETGADNAESEALQAIGQMLMKFLGGEQEPSQIDLDAAMIAEARTVLANIDKSLAMSARAKRRAERLLGRFKTRDGEPTPMEKMLRWQIEQHERIAAQNGNAKRSFESAIKMLQSWNFEREQSLASLYLATTPYANRMQSSASTSGFTW
jgi:curved DNA-binding protein CbpA